MSGFTGFDSFFLRNYELFSPSVRKIGRGLRKLAPKKITELRRELLSAITMLVLGKMRICWSPFPTSSTPTVRSAWRHTRTTWTISGTVRLTRREPRFKMDHLVKSMRSLKN